MTKEEEIKVEKKLHDVLKLIDAYQVLVDELNEPYWLQDSQKKSEAVENLIDECGIIWVDGEIAWKED
jgi:hypothetical protein